MKTDRELLELAARAAGYVVNTFNQTGRDACGAGDVGLWIANLSTCWNPLTDDGDALRLAVKLRLDVIHDEPHDQDAWVMAGGDLDCVEDVDGEGSRAAATRRAIVRAAAAIGEALP